MSKTAAVVLTVLVLAVIAVGVYTFVPGINPAYNSPGVPNTGGTINVTTPQPTTNTYNNTYVSTTTYVAIPKADHIVTYTNSGFTPTVIYVKKGESVAFINNSTIRLWVASNPHPEHTNLASFDERDSIGSGDSWTYTFGVTGTFGYHNHLNPASTGTVVVQ